MALHSAILVENIITVSPDQHPVTPPHQILARKHKLHDTIQPDRYCLNIVKSRKPLDSPLPKLKMIIVTYREEVDKMAKKNSYSAHLGPFLHKFGPQLYFSRKSGFVTFFHSIDPNKKARKSYDCSHGKFADGLTDELTDGTDYKGPKSVSKNN